MRKYSIQYERALNRLVDKLYQEAFARGWSWEKMAEKSGLALQTVCNLGNYVTRVPQFRTVELIAQSLGGSLVYREGMITAYKRRQKQKRLYKKDLKLLKVKRSA